MLRFLCAVEFFAVIALLSASGAELNVEEESALIDSLERIIEFLYFDYEHVNIDGLFGVTIAEAQLNLILQESLVQNDLYNKMLSLRDRFHQYIQLMKSNRAIFSRNDNYEMLQSIIHPKLWQISKPFTYGLLRNLNTYNWKNVSESFLLQNIINNGHPNEHESDQCIAELLNDDNTRNSIHTCFPSEKCTKIMDNLDTSNGYPLTHKLLYLQLAKVWKCSLDEIVYEEKMVHICSRILQEFRSIESMHSSKFSDLYMEQMVLCGIEGFPEFLTKESRQNLLQWLIKWDSYGCYGYKTPHTTDRMRKKRTTRRMLHGCESHSTGLGVASISLNLRYLLTVVKNNV